MRTEVGVLLVGGLLALTGCGGGGSVVTKTVTAPSHTTVPATVKKATPGNEATAAAIATAASALGGVGDVVLAPAALVAAATNATGSSGAARAAGTPPASDSSTQAAVAATKTISAHAVGEVAVAHINGAFPHPSQITLKISATPSQPGSVFWTLVCLEHGGGVGQEHKQTASEQLPLSQTLPLPAASSSCDVSANVQLSKSGSVTISITA